MELTGRTALVTGGARRIGRAIVEALAQAGARVAIHCRSSLGEARKLARRFPGAVVVEADLADPEAAAALAGIAEEALGGRLDVLVNNASTFVRAPLGTWTPESVRSALDVNLAAPLLLSHHAGMRMRARGGGCIVNLTDWAIARPYADYVPYFAAKAGLASATAGLARALAPEVRVNAVAPGPILMPEGTDAAYEAKVVGATPLGRLGGPESVVAAVLFLIGHEFMTGNTVTVDGGRSLR